MAKSLPNRFAQQWSLTARRLMMHQFGETVVYYPRSGGSRTITAHVRRNTMEIIQETGDLASQALIVTVPNDTCKGISSDEIDTGGDEIAVALRVGLTTQRRSVARILSDHNGMTRILVQ